MSTSFSREPRTAMVSPRKGTDTRGDSSHWLGGHWRDGGWTSRRGGRAIADPGNLTYLPGSGLLIIAEDTSNHQIDMIWAYDIATGGQALAVAGKTRSGLPPPEPRHRDRPKSGAGPRQDRSPRISPHLSWLPESLPRLPQTSRRHLGRGGFDWTCRGISGIFSHHNPFASVARVRAARRYRGTRKLWLIK